MHEVAVVILNWNGLDFLKSFLPGVVQHSCAMADVYVIDNASSDNSISWIKENIPEVKIIHNPVNYGFAKGYNEGLKHVQSKYFVLLNSDVEVTENWIPPVIAYMKSEGITAAQPKILDYNRKTFFEHAGATGGFIDRHGFVFCAGRIFDAFEEDHGQYNENKEVFWASGAALFIQAQAYFDVGGLDEDFFAHMEEIDLCWRLKNKGFRIGACGQSTVYHVGGGTLSKINPFKTFLNFRNNLFILVKNYHDSNLTFLLFRRLMLDGIAAIRFLSEGKTSYFIAVFKAHMAFYFHFRLMRRKRRLLAAGMSNENRVGWYTKSILVSYYLRKKSHFSDLNVADFHHS
ncbi:MAG: glycosyltransferase [Cryomorphaceae bacterium]|nr:glycosyltransferase [Cryomorphaceae bacterium]